MIMSVNMAPRAVTPQDNGWRIPKMDGPDPGSYELVTSFDKTQKPGQRGSIKSTEKRTPFTDAISKLYKNNVPIGKYNDMDKGLKL